MNEALPLNEQEIRTICELHSVDQVIRVISPRGNGKKIKTNKPKDGWFAYVWRQARFNVGDDMTLPVMAEYDLVDWVRKHLGRKISVTDPGLRPIGRALDALSIRALYKMQLRK